MPTNAAIGAQPALVGIFLLALTLRLAAIALVGPSPDIVGYSESGLTAANLVQGRGYTYDYYGLRQALPLQAFMPPLFVGFVYLCLKFSANPPLIFALAQAFLSALTCLAVYWLAIELSRNRIVALLAALGVACYPVLILMVTVPASLTLHLAVLAWALAFTAPLARRRSAGYALAAGVLWGVMGLGRPAMLAFLPCIVLWLALNRDASRRWLRDGAVLVAAAVLIVVPWTIRNAAVLGRFVPVATNGGFVFWNGNNPFTTGSGHDVYTDKASQFLGRPVDAQLPAVMQWQPYPLPPEIQRQVATLPETELDRRLLQAGLDFMRQEPRAWAALLGRKVIAFWWFRENLGAAYEGSWTRYYKPLYILTLLLTAAGLALSVAQWRRYSLLYLFFGFTAVTYIGFQVLTRYRWEIEPFFLIFAALAVTALASRLVAPKRAASPP
ncbi:MAG: hypothetical protein MUC51_13315 [Anaerolineae bacterium]|nr:hypothetical protein [Anaerolineae bacterium]